MPVIALTPTRKQARQLRTACLWLIPGCCAGTEQLSWSGAFTRRPSICCVMALWIVSGGRAAKPATHRPAQQTAPSVNHSGNSLRDPSCGLCKRKQCDYQVKQERPVPSTSGLVCMQTPQYALSRMQLILIADVSNQLGITIPCIQLKHAASPFEVLSPGLSARQNSVMLSAISSAQVRNRASGRCRIPCPFLACAVALLCATSASAAAAKAPAGHQRRLCRAETGKPDGCTKHDPALCTRVLCGSP